MVQIGKTVSQRIRTVRSSLKNAEQNFSANQEIRGELDLMLAEAELKNLRRKKDVPWSWNRQVLAGCAAVLLVLTGIGGWYLSKNHYRARYQRTRETQAVVVQPQPEAGKIAITNPAPSAPDQQASTDQAPAAITTEPDAASAPAVEQAAASRVYISKAEMHQLVHSARTELNKAQ